MVEVKNMKNDDGKLKLSRRDFLRLAGVGAGAVAVSKLAVFLIPLADPNAPGGLKQ